MPRSRLRLVVVLWACASPARALLCPLGGEVVRRIAACRPEVPLDRCRAAAAAVGCNVVRELESVHAVVVEVPAADEAASDERLRSLAEVRRVEPDPRLNWLRQQPRLPSVEETLAPFLRERVSAPRPAPPDPEQPWGVRRVKAAEAWPRAAGSGAAVCVIDTGVDRSHPDIAPNLAGGANVADPKSPEGFQDDQGHGTHVAGTIAGARNGRDVVGVAPSARLYAVKVLDNEGNGTFDEIIAGIEWCAQNKVPVANLSLGADEGSQALQDALAWALRRGTLIVAAAGNDPAMGVSFPARYPEAVSVGASDRADGVASFSSRGKVDFIAPGVQVSSARLGGGTVSHDGTSMAAPHVAGLAALAWSMGARGPAALRAALAAAAAPLPGLKPADQGGGMIEAPRLRP